MSNTRGRCAAAAREACGSHVARASTIAARVRVFRAFHDGTLSGPGCVANPSNAQLLELLPTAVGPFTPATPHLKHPPNPTLPHALATST
eukprot:scaffold31418_cov90-Isochrysis_galbana.AAC.3